MSDAQTPEKKVTRLKNRKDIVKGTHDMFDVDPRTVEIEPGYNPRDFSTPRRQKRLASLARSIAEVGVLVPIVIRYVGGKALLVDGETRLRATWKAIEDGAPIRTIPAVPEKLGTSDRDRLAGVLVRNGGEGDDEGAGGTSPLTMLEQAVAVTRLRNVFGVSVEEITRLTGYTDRHIANLLALNGAPEPVKAMVREDRVAGSTALKALATEDPVQTLTEAITVAGESGKTRATPKHVRKAHEARTGAKRLSAKDAEGLVKALVQIARFTTDADSREASFSALRQVGVVDEKGQFVKAEGSEEHK